MVNSAFLIRKKSKAKRKNRMSLLKQHINTLKDLIANAEAEIAPYLDQTEQLEKLKKQLQILTKRINVMVKSGEEVRPELKEQKIKLALKIDDIEQTILCVKELAQVGSSLLKTYGNFLNSSNPINSKIINDFDGIKDSQFGAFKTDRFFKDKMKDISINELAKVINAACNLKGDNLLYIFDSKMMSKNDMNFQEEFYKSLEIRFVDVLNFNNIKKPHFRTSEFLQYYANYTLKRNSRDLT